MTLDLIHQHLRQAPPPGVSPAYVDAFFARNRSAMQRILTQAFPSSTSGMEVDGAVLGNAVRSMIRAAAGSTFRTAPQSAPKGMAFGLTIRGEAGFAEVAASNGEVAARVRMAVSGDPKKAGLSGVCLTREQAENLMNLTGPVRLSVSQRTLTVQSNTTQRLRDLRNPLPGFEYMWPEFHQTGWDLVTERVPLLNLVLAAEAENAASAANLAFHKTTVALSWDKNGPRLTPMAGDSGASVPARQFSAAKTKGEIGLSIPYLRDALESLSGPVVRLRQPGGRAALSKLSPIEITENTDEQTRPAWLIAPVRLETL